MRIRPPFRPDELSGERFFRWRGGEVSRLEGLGDGVFALALAFLVVRADVPDTIEGLRALLWAVPAYVACFALFLWIWYCHYQFHRRYGLEDPLTVAVDGAILLLVLLWVVPLRFLANGLNSLFVHGGPFDGVHDPADSRELLVTYALGFALVFLLLAFQTWLARRRAERLELDRLELAVTDGTIRAHLFTAAVGLASVGLSLFGGALAWAAGPIFAALGPLHWINGAVQGRRLEALEARLAASGSTD